MDPHSLGWRALALAIAVLLYVLFRQQASKWTLGIGIAAAVALLLSLVVGDAAGQSLDVRMPPNEFIHPFVGKVVVMELPHKTGAPLLSLSHHGDGVCAIWLPRVGGPDITEELYRCLIVIEVANCNGAIDINLPAVKARASFGEQSKYARTCSQGHWDWAFNRVRLAAAGY